MKERRLSIDELGRLVRDERRRRGQSLRVAAGEIGTSFNTLSRVERGHVPDLRGFESIVEWLGLDPAAFFVPSRQREITTTESVTHLLRSDPALTGQAAEQISELVATLYGRLATPPLRFNVHLRAASTFKPQAAEALAGILEQMQQALERRPA